MSKEHKVCALLCYHWKSELLQEAATGWRTAGFVCMGARLMDGQGGRSWRAGDKVSTFH